MAATLAAADSAESVAVPCLPSYGVAPDGRAAVGVAPDGLFVLAWVDQTRLLVTMWDGVSWTEPAQIAAAGAIANLLVGRMDGKLAVSWDQDIDADPNVVILGRMASTYSGYWSEPEPPTREVSSSPGISAAVNAVRSNILVGSGDFLELLASCPNRDGLWAAMGIGSPPKDPCCEKKKDEPPEDEEEEEPPPPPPVCEYPGDCPEPPPDDPPDTPLPPGTPRPPLPPLPPDPPWPPDDDYEPEVIRPEDPNDIVGPAGFGDERWVTAAETLPYIIRFENKPDATAPATVVTVSQQLDADLDWRTFRVSGFGWGDVLVEFAEPRAFVNQTIDLTATEGFLVQVVALVDVVTGEAFWSLTTIDPKTGDLPEDPLVGFLPPNVTSTGSGQGFVSYTVRPRGDAITGEVIDAQARIVFDTEEPLDTPPIFNTIDAVAPASAVDPLPPTDQGGGFTVSWKGTDDIGGSALADFTIYVSDNYGGFEPWLEETSLTEGTFVGEPGHEYEFYSRARDNAGNSQAAPATLLEPAIPTLSIADATVSEGAGTAVLTITLNPSSTAAITVDYDTSDGSAVGGLDYASTSSAATIPSGVTSTTIAITIIDDSIYEGAEIFTVNLSNAPAGAAISATGGSAAVTIIDDDATPILSVGDVTVEEGTGAAVIIEMSLVAQHPSNEG